jgi:DNA-binding response OmpR family regulator
MHKILLVDDNTDMLFLVEQILSKKGYMVKVLANGKDVLPLMHTFYPDLVILDINLGDTDGREICNAIKSQPLLKNIPVILYSAELLPDLRITECQADAFVHKPFVHRLFLEKIAGLLAA